MLIYDDLALFLEVAELQSFSKAAKRTRVPVSTLSRRIQQLEETLQCKLVERNARQTVLTNRGKEFYERLRNEFKSMQLNVEELVDTSKTLKGELTITAPTYVGNTLLGVWFTEFMQQYPDIHLRVYLSSRIEDIVAKNMDLAFRCGPLESSNLVARKLFRYRYEIFAAQNYFSENPKISQPSDLSAHRFIQLKYQPNQFVFKPRASHCIKAEPQVVEIIKGSITNDVQWAISAAKSGLGLVCLPYLCLQSESSRSTGLEQVYFSNYELDYGTDVHAVYSDRRYQSKAFKTFLEFIYQKVESAYDFESKARDAEGGEPKLYSHLKTSISPA